jgi:8-oxo-dGTP pyrophosphatase MutT (NUDIX family)
MSLAAVLKKNLFWMVSRTALWGYRRMPIFGSLRASLGLIRNAERVLVIRRNDGRGVCFPGGLSWPWESDEMTLIREIQEETGLSCQSFEFAFRYESDTDIAARIAVFDVQATGQLRGSWEGTPEWVKIEDVQPDLLPSQKYIVDRLSGRSQ